MRVISRRIAAGSGIAPSDAGLLPRKGFTLVELLVAMAITLILVVLISQILGVSSRQWKQTNDNAKAFQGARAAFDSMTRTLSQATLATGYDYYNAARQSRVEAAESGSADAFVPDIYGRSSALHFISGKDLASGQLGHSVFFQAPLDFDSAQTETASGQLNAIGFFLKSIQDPDDPLGSPRDCLMEYFQPTTLLETYKSSSGRAWFKTDVDAALPANSHVLAENIVVLVFLPRLPDEQSDDGQPVEANAIAPGYEYDSRVTWTSGAQPPQMHQLPPIVRTLMVAVDETTAKRHPDLADEFDALFQEPSDFEDNLGKVEEELQKIRANYRVFRADVPIRSAKWSK